MHANDKGLTAGQLAIMALGTVVGGSFFLGSSIAVRSAGPAVVISYIIGGILVYSILFALSEMTVADTEPGSFRTYAQRIFGNGAGFVVGWVYWTGLILAMSSEAIAVSVFVRAWIPQFSLPVLGSIVIIIVTVINLFGVERLSKLEGTLAFIKLSAIAGFTVIGVMLISGIYPDKPAAGLGHLVQEPLFPGRLGGIAGSMLIVMFTYAGFEIIGLAATEANSPQKTVPRAIKYTVFGLVGLYTTAIFVLLPLIPTANLSEDTSPMVAALELNGITWVADIMNIVLVTAILSTMLAATFGLGRMIRSLAEEGHAPFWLRDNKGIPFRGIIFSGASMLAALTLGFILPKYVYIFLVSSGGFSLLFTYTVIVATHYKFRKKNGCPPSGKCQLPGYPYTSLITFIILIAVIVSMPLVEGQGSGLAAGIILVVFYSLTYMVTILVKKLKKREHSEKN